VTPPAGDWAARARRLSSRAVRAARRLAPTAPPATRPRYAVRAAVLAVPSLAHGLRPHWDQVDLADPGSPSAVDQLRDADLLLAQLPDPVSPDWPGAPLLRAARDRRVPVVLWDTAAAPAGERPDHVAVLELAAAADHLATVATDRVPGYAAALPGTPVWELAPGVTPWENLPVGMAGRATSVVVLEDHQVTGTPDVALRAAARGTALVSAPRPALEQALDGAVWTEGDPAARLVAARALRRQPELRDRQAHLARRAALSRHTWAHRVETVLDRLGLAVAPPDRSVTALVPTRRPDQVGHVVDTVAAQVGVPVELVLVTHGFTPPEAELRARAAERGLEHVTVVPADPDLTLGAVLNLGTEAASGRFTAKMDDDNLYGPHYLQDLVLELGTTSAQVVGKWTHYVHLTGSDAVLLRFAGHEHREVDLVQGGTIVMATEDLRGLGFADLPRRVDTTLLDRVRADGGRVWSADRYNFVSRRGDPGGHTWTVTDAELLTRASTVVFYGDPSRHAIL